ncbi:MAG: hypothetical protein RIC29_13125 [Rhodospirillaceae bacterium]
MTKPIADHRLFLSHWMDLRGVEALLPTSEAFLDKPNPLFAPNILVLDVFDDDLIIRLQATELVERWGVDLTGQSMFNASLPMNKPDMLKNVERLMQQPCGLLSVHKTETSGGRKLIIETLGLPLSTPARKSPRMVNYSWLIDPLEDGEHSEKVTVYERQEWIDIGAGIPSEKPLKPMTPSNA